MSGRSENDAFSRCHPLVSFLFFAGAIVMGAMITHPVCILAEFCGALLYTLLLHGSYGLKLLRLTLPAALVLALVNPLLNHRGETVLTYVPGGPYTLEALLYGITLASMILVVLLWGSCYSTVMTSDRFMALFGGLVPTISMLLMLVLRLIPDLLKKARQITEARCSIGKGPLDGSSLREKITAGLSVLSALLGWALEGGLLTADAMRSRGYGTGKRTRFSQTRSTRQDAAMLALIAMLAVLILHMVFSGATDAAFTPRIEIPALRGRYLPGFLAFCIFLSLPSMLYIKEAIQWRISRSGI